MGPSFHERHRIQLLNEYTRSVVRDGATCAALDCGNQVLRSHVGEALRKLGKLGEPARKEDVYAGRKPRAFECGGSGSARNPPRLDWQRIRELGNYKVTWVDRVTSLNRKTMQVANTVPPWVWVSIGLAYLSITLARMRAQSRHRVQDLSLTR